MTACYVYGVVDATSSGIEDRLLALRRTGSLVTVVGDGELAAVVEPVSLDEFGEDVLPARLNDRAWLEAKVTGHARVLESFLDAGPVVPLRFGTIYDESTDVTDFLRSRRERLGAALEAVRGRVELGVKGWADRRQVQEFAVGRTAAQPTTGGRAYLEQRQRQREAAERVSELLSVAATDAHRRLLAAAVAGVANRPQPRELTARPEAMFLNGAYLVPAADTALRQAAAELAEDYADEGLSFEVTGPWPAYNFVDLGDDA